MAYLTNTPTAIENVEIIKNSISKPDLYEQLAEEAAELAQAANKMARTLRGTNPTPKTELEAQNSVIEEYTDVVNVAGNILDIHPDWLIGDYKLYRWMKRIEKDKQEKHHGKCGPDYCEL